MIDSFIDIIYCLFSNFLRRFILFFIIAGMVWPLTELLTNFFNGANLSITLSSVDSKEFQHDCTVSYPYFQFAWFNSLFKTSFVYFLQSRLNVNGIFSLSPVMLNVINLWSPNSGLEVLRSLALKGSVTYTWSSVDSLSWPLITLDHVVKPIIWIKSKFPRVLSKSLKRSF